MTIYDFIFLSWTIPIASNYFTSWSGIIDKLKLFLFYRKYTKKTPYVPFRIPLLDCAGCFSTHLAWIYMLINGYDEALTIGITALCAGGIAAFINYKLS